ncbi:hypothetical protein EYF80_035689 [Liparis tanakae]|uniref:Uncharacterized protein n=1 Tax=Liparis tanakae TaxID=230148 RepID=A0A4Z2GKG1_9TELE|nr:hypothetical protein EYF80_035689 [Liparis tanakae]
MRSGSNGVAAHPATLRRSLSTGLPRGRPTRHVAERIHEVVQRVRSRGFGTRSRGFGTRSSFPPRLRVQCPVRCGRCVRRDRFIVFFPEDFALDTVHGAVDVLFAVKGLVRSDRVDVTVARRTSPTRNGDALDSRGRVARASVARTLGTSLRSLASRGSSSAPRCIRLFVLKHKDGDLETPKFLLKISTALALLLLSPPPPLQLLLLLPFASFASSPPLSSAYRSPPSSDNREFALVTRRLKSLTDGSSLQSTKEVSVRGLRDSFPLPSSRLLIKLGIMQASAIGSSSSIPESALPI